MKCKKGGPGDDYREPSGGKAVEGNKSATQADTARKYHDGTPPKGGSKRSKRKGLRIRVIPIIPDRYPEYARDPEHPCCGMANEQRVKDLVDTCARLWARSCEEAAQDKSAA